VVEEAGFRCQPADELGGPGAITEVVLTAIVDAAVLVADLSGKNPNVFYEIGVAHFFGKGRGVDYARH
jgi:hypothetical protein